MSTDNGIPVPPGTSSALWEAMGAERVAGGWRMPERDGSGRVIGWHTRADNGGHKNEGPRGIALRWPLPERAGTTPQDPVIVTEGGSDAVAGLGLGLDTVAAPMAGHGGGYLATVLRGRHVAICADNDPAGVKGGAKLADELASACASVRVFSPPYGHKDLRVWIAEGIAARGEVLGAIAAIAPRKGQSAPAHTRPILIRACDIQPKRVRWLWRNRFPLGKLSCIAGDPGLGKSSLLLDMAGRVSVGKSWPDNPGEATEAGDVVILSAEDDAEDTVVPRLLMAGANLTRIVLLQAVAIGENGQREVTLADADQIGSAVASLHNCRLIIIDPVTAYFGGINAHRNDEVRALLKPLATLASERSVSIVLNTHLNKSAGGKGVYRMTGSLALPAACRAAWLVTEDPRPDADRKCDRLFLPAKMNLCVRPQALAFSMQEAEGSDHPVLLWSDKPVDMSADEALASEAACTPDERSAVEAAEEWIKEALAGGPVESDAILEQAKKAAISMGSLRRAKVNLRVKSQRVGFSEPAVWYWRLPGQRLSPSGIYTPEGAEAEERPDDLGDLPV